MCTNAINAEFARFSQRSITRNYEPSSRTARNCAEQGVGFCGQRSALCVRDCRPHGSHNAVMCDFSALHTKRQPIAEFCAKQGVRFCTRGSVRRYVTERARFSQRSITRNYKPSSRTARNCAEQGVGFCRQRSALCVRDCRPHGSHNAVMCDFSALHTKRQPIAEFCAKQGVRFCTRGSVRRYVTERARFSQRSITRNYALATKNYAQGSQ